MNFESMILWKSIILFMSFSEFGLKWSVYIIILLMRITQVHVIRT